MYSGFKLNISGINTTYKPNIKELNKNKYLDKFYVNVK